MKAATGSSGCPFTGYRAKLIGLSESTNEGWDLCAKGWLRFTDGHRTTGCNGIDKPSTLATLVSQSS
ncbi:hypothetical protein [Olivibacter jilunii]|uniref:hypothetical protein n=1 Tax=Olivibacter jilunii TaxID=985016 RepID=UPI003F152E6D